MYRSFQLAESTRFVSLCGYRYAIAAANRYEADSGCLRKADESRETVLHLVAIRWHEVVEDVDKSGVGAGDLCEVVR
jgi:hypothetical protein